jgi:type IV secretion system protein TrbL
MVAEYLWYFIRVLSDAINSIMPYSRKLLDIITILAVTWLGIETALGKNDFSTLVEKILILGINIFLIKNLSYLSHMVLSSLLKLSSTAGDTAMGTSLLENPAVLLDYAHSYIIKPTTDVVAEQFGGLFDAVSSAFNLLTNPNGFWFIIMYILLILVVYVCFAIIIVQIVLNYILYHITLFFGYILAPFSIFKPLDFIGKNVFKALLTQALTLAVIVFVANIGLSAFKAMFTTSLMKGLNTNNPLMSVGLIWLMIASVLIYLFVCLQSPTLVMSIISGSPTLGAGGLLSTIAAIGTTVATGIGGMAAGGAAGGQSVNAVQGAGAAAGGGGGGGALAAAQSAGQNQFLPRTVSSGPSVNTITQSGSMAALPAASPSPFLPAPSRPMLEDKTGLIPAVPSKPMNDSDSGFSYKVL